MVAGSLTLTNSEISGNTSNGVLLVDRAHQVTLNGSRITNNAGAGISSFGPSGDAETVVLRNSVINGNRAGGLRANSVILENSVVSDNQSTGWGGGLVVGYGATGRGQLTATGSTISGNRTPGNGGGLFLADGAALTLTNSTVSGNSASTGGGIYQVGSVTLQILRSTIANNTATVSGGGLLLSGGADLTLTNSTVSGNSAQTGGGIYQAGSATLHILSSTIANNSATSTASGPNGSRIYRLRGSADIRNTLVANNTGSPNCFRLTPFTSLGHNLDSGFSCGFNDAADKNSTDPNLGPLADNGGPTLTHALLPDSPAIDAGTDDGCPPTDQRGAPRPVDGNRDGTPSCDIGAYEAGGIIPTPTPSPTPTPTHTPTPTLTPTVTATPIATACSPRPRVAVDAVPDGDGRLRVTVSATTNPGTANALQSVTWQTMDRATVTMAGGRSMSAGQTMPLSAGAQTFTFLVGRIAPGQAATVHFVVVDACGPWPTFVGGGPNAF